MQVFGQRSGLGVLALVAALPFSSCGGGSGSGSGAGPTVPVVVPTPTPTPASTPTPVLSASCARLPPGNPNPTTCRTEAPTFLGDVEDAIDTLRAEQPTLFDGDQVLNVGAYYVGLIKVLDRKGLCADFDGEELGVTNTSDYSDVLDVLTARDQVRRFYVGTCYPSLVPLSRGAPAPSPSGCSLPPSKEIACGREPEGRFFGDVASGIEELLKSRPELFDFGDVNPGTDWPRVKDMGAYHAALVSLLVGKGYCGIFDGEEIQLKRTNEFTEHYDVNYADKYIRTGPGTYRGSCYPAAF
jgi:hypothetical protein